MVSKQLFLSGLTLRHRFVKAERWMTSSIRADKCPRQIRYWRPYIHSVAKPGSMIECVLLQQTTTTALNHMLYQSLLQHPPGDLLSEMPKANRIKLRWLAYANYEVFRICRDHGLSSLNAIQMYSCILRTIVEEPYFWQAALLPPPNNDWETIYLEIVRIVIRYPLPNIPVVMSTKRKLRDSLRMYLYRKAMVRLIRALFKLSLLLIGLSALLWIWRDEVTFFWHNSVKTNYNSTVNSLRSLVSNDTLATALNEVACTVRDSVKKFFWKWYISAIQNKYMYTYDKWVVEYGGGKD